jgi:hypothetical protein
MGRLKPGWKPRARALRAPAWTCVLSAFAGTALLAAWPAPALAQTGVRPVAVRLPEVRAANVLLGGTINGIVSDDRGGPLKDAMVSVLGATIATTTTDVQGRFFLDSLPAGEYTLRAHLPGFVASRREHIRIGSATSTIYRLELRRLDVAVTPTGRTPDTLPARPILAAGFGLPRVEPAPPPVADADHPHTETAWRLRHLPRSILKESGNTPVLTGEDDENAPAEPLFGGAKSPPASLATSLFAGLPFSGEVNLLTTGVFAPGRLFEGSGQPRGVAYLAIGAPTSAGDWALRTAMSEGDLSSWIVAGSFVSKRDAFHSYDLGLSYSTQEYQGGNPAALAAVTDGSRNVGEIYALDRWTVGPGVSFEYGGRYARYDYLARPGLFSPRAGFTLEPVKGTRVTAVLAQRMIAPGAEEFLSPGVAGAWLPPERTFSPLVGHDFRVQRARYLDVLFEHEFSANYAVGVRRFFQGVDNQLMTLFGVQTPSSGARSVGHYYVASAGAVDAQGWAVRLSIPMSKRLGGSIDYSRTRSRWTSRGDLASLVPGSSRQSRPDLESIHDITTSFHTDIPETATRVFVLYKINSAYMRGTTDFDDAGFDGRFDVQVNQALPFGLLGTKWEVLVGVRNLFRDPNDVTSVYDELLVVRPPKRVVGGFLVRF